MHHNWISPLIIQKTIMVKIERLAYFRALAKYSTVRGCENFMLCFAITCTYKNRYQVLLRRWSPYVCFEIFLGIKIVCMNHQSSYAVDKVDKYFEEFPKF